MSATFGTSLHLSLFGQSHGEGIGLVMDGFPAGMTLDMEAILREVARRKPGSNDVSTKRKEDDLPEFVSGIFQGKTSGQPICILIRNQGQHSRDYGDQVDLVRPSHADYTGHVRYFGFEDFRGGGSFSGRLTAPIVVAGEMCRQWLATKGVRIETHIRRLENIQDDAIETIPETKDLSFLRSMTLPVLRKGLDVQMHDTILAASQEADSVGGILEGRIVGLPAGLGSPFFDSVESVLSHLFFSIPAVKGVAFGRGFELAGMRGSEANDAYRYESGRIVTQTNYAGGINGGITNGMPVIYTCAMRPTPSIGKVQETISLVQAQNAELTIRGRHDPCILARAVPVMDAMAAIGIMDLWKERGSCLQ